MTLLLLSYSIQCQSRSHGIRPATTSQQLTRLFLLQVVPGWHDEITDEDQLKLRIRISNQHRRAPTSAWLELEREESHCHLLPYNHDDDRYQVDRLTADSQTQPKVSSNTAYILTVSRVAHPACLAMTQPPHQSILMTLLTCHRSRPLTSKYTSSRNLQKRSRHRLTSMTPSLFSNRLWHCTRTRHTVQKYRRIRIWITNSSSTGHALPCSAPSVPGLDRSLSPRVSVGDGLMD